MPTFTKPTLGAFCWFDIVTTDPAAAKKYYGELFGWSFKEMPGATPYTMALVGENAVGGIVALPPEAKQMNTPPHLMPYVAVEDVAKASAKAVSLGAKELMKMSGEWGDMALIQDPTGGTVSLWRAKQTTAWLYDETSAMCWNELVTTDVAKATTFYSQLFGWTTDTMPMPSGHTYTMFKNRAEMAAGMMATPPQMKGMPTVWATYLQVADADQTIARAQKMGGKVLVPAMDAEGVGRFAMLQDAQGAAFGILQAKRPAK